MTTETLVLKDDPRFKQGISLMESERFEEAAEHFSELLTVLITTENELDSKLAPLYFQYGSSLLAQLENACDDNGAFEAALAIASQAAKKEEKPGEAVLSASNENAVSSNGEINSEEISDKVSRVIEEDRIKRAEEEEEKEIAWENLELARSIYSKIENPTLEDTIALARTHDRLADLHTMNNNDPGVVEELEAETLILEKSLPPTCEHLTDVRLKLMLSYCACAGQNEISAEDMSKLRNMALDQGKKVISGFRAIAQRIESSLSDNSDTLQENHNPTSNDSLSIKAHRMLELDGGGSVEDKRSRLKRVNESITDVEQLCMHIKDELKSAEEAGITTEGFINTPNEARGTSPDISKEKQSPPVVTMLEPKKKRKSESIEGNDKKMLKTDGANEADFAGAPSI